MHHGAGLLPLFAMWAAMMVAMMTPAEAPAFVQLARARGPATGALFLAGALAPWIAFSLLAALLQQALHASGLLDHESGALGSPLLSAGLLVAAGALQLAPWKRACVERCREAAQSGSWIAGIRAGGLSILSCGALMLVPFATGVMKPWPMILITALLAAGGVWLAL